MTMKNLKSRITNIEKKYLPKDVIPHLEFVYTEAHTSNTEAIEHFISSYRDLDKLTDKTEYIIVRYDKNKDIYVTKCNPKGIEHSKPWYLKDVTSLEDKDLKMMDRVFRQGLERIDNQ